MATTIRLPIIKVEGSTIFKVYLAAFLMIPIIFFALLVVVEDDNNWIGKSFLICLAVYVLIGFFLKKPCTIENGFLTINKYEFIYQLGNKTACYSLDNMSNISLLYGGFDGRSRTLSYFLTDSGEDNFIKFTFQGQEKCYNLMLKYEYLGLLRKVINDCESIGKPIVVLDFRGKRTRI